jgi:hypothetical protein
MEENAMLSEMVRRVGMVLRDEHGIETLEWIAMAFLIIVLVAVVAYPGGLLAAIQGVIANIVAAL